MKSMLQEASSVFKAVEKAWNNCGKPQEFTIKILEFGDKNFWGITKNPAVISISYDPKKQTTPPIILQGKVAENVQKTEIQKKPTFINKFDKNLPQNDKFKQHQNQKTDVSQDAKKDIFPGWTNELISDVSIWLKEISLVMDLKTTFEVKAEQKILNVYLDKRIIKEAEDEKLFFISLSHLLMQFLKRKYKRRFSNFYLIIHSRVTGVDEQKKAAPSN